MGQGIQASPLAFAAAWACTAVGWGASVWKGLSAFSELADSCGQLTVCSHTVEPARGLLDSVSLLDLCVGVALAVALACLLRPAVHVPPPLPVLAAPVAQLPEEPRRVFRDLAVDPRLL